MLNLPHLGLRNYHKLGKLDSACPCFCSDNNNRSSHDHSCNANQTHVRLKIFFSQQRPSTIHSLYVHCKQIRVSSPGPTLRVSSATSSDEGLQLIARSPCFSLCSFIIRFKIDMKKDNRNPLAK
mmetsp:Transcript_1292/g.1849  ORF Transcript_1292/g.1849 Transcript_1292/m.1849 type:complete len:124 (-) Transcript_1292:212-583(-)